MKILVIGVAERDDFMEGGLKFNAGDYLQMLPITEAALEDKTFFASYLRDRAAVLFADAFKDTYMGPGGRFRERKKEDQVPDVAVTIHGVGDVFIHQPEPDVRKKEEHDSD